MNIQGVVVGLGNPGAQYKNTKHNMGFLALEKFLENLPSSARIEKLSSNKFSCILFRVDFSSNNTWLFAFPQTFMNLSGECVQPLLAWYKLSYEKLLVVHDELDLIPPRIQLKKGGGIAGHNGLKSISQKLGTLDFYRLRVGIGRPEHSSQVSSWVLTGFANQDDFHAAIEESSKAIENIINEGFAKAINTINVRKKKN